MKVLGVCFSQRKGGNSETLLQEALRGAEECGAEIRFLSLGNTRIEPCLGCQKCKEAGVCVHRDDMQEFYPQLLETDGLILSSPVYGYSIAGIGKMFLDRIYALKSPRLRLMNKVGGGITVASSAGNISAFHTFNMFFLTNRMFTTDYVAGYATIGGHVKRHRHAMLASYELGRLVAQTAAKGLEYPSEFDRSLYLLVKEKYGVHMSPFEDDEPTPPGGPE